MHELKRMVLIVPSISGPRFRTIPTVGQSDDINRYRAFLVKSETVVRREEGLPIMRYAAYIRVSDDEQVNGYSLDAQRRLISDWIISKGGTLVKVYADEGESARTADRTNFQQMRLDAHNGKFDAVVVHKFDRFARNRTDSLAIKSLLRYDYKIKVVSVTEPSEDSDGPIGALIEGIMECVADWYSRNLAQEVAKGKHERSRQGLHNNQAPFGMKKNKQKVLVPDNTELAGLRLAFKTYGAGKHSDHDIATLLNERGYRTKLGRPFSKDTVREMLQNKTYLGKVRYQEYRTNADRSRSWSAPVEWNDGQHKSVIPEDLFNHCQDIRAERATHRQATPKYNPYVLRDLVYCYRCCNHAPTAYTFPAYGKMRAQAQKHGAVPKTSTATASRKRFPTKRLKIKSSQHCHNSSRLRNGVSISPKP